MTSRLAALVLGVALASATLVSGAAFFVPHPLPADLPSALLGGLTQWDAGWYAEIVQHGYWYAPGQQSPVAFFPLYPLVLRALSEVGVNRWFAGVSVSFIAALAAIALFRRWAETVRPALATPATLLLVLYPFAEYLYGVMYSDALFLLLAVGAFLLLERDRPWWAALVGALATACRPVAPALVAGLLVRSWERARARQGPFRLSDFAPVLAACGFAAYVAYLGMSFHEPFAFAVVQGAPGWDQPAGWHTWLKVSWFHTLFPRSSPEVAIRLGGHALVTVLALALSVRTFRVLGAGYGVYTLLAVAIPAWSSKDFQGLGRYVIAAFPLFLTGAAALEPHPRAMRGWLAVSALLLAALAVALGMGRYVS